MISMLIAKPTMMAAVASITSKYNRNALRSVGSGDDALVSGPGESNSRLPINRQAAIGGCAGNVWPACFERFDGGKSVVAATTRRLTFVFSPGAAFTLGAERVAAAAA